MSIVVQKFDDWIFDNKLFGFQINSNRFQELTGLTCFWLAKCCVIAWCLLFLYWLYIFFNNNSIVIVAIFVVFAIGVLFVRVIDNQSKIWNSHDCVMNKSRLDNVCIRVLLIVFLFIPTLMYFFVARIDFFYVFAAFLNISSIYFYACTPLPPSKSKLRKWCEKVFRVLDRCATHT